uniref:Uncharacterized protein n=1 Tax=Rhizophora mucronata TaxID=61149 RepID=A0A2P2J538_RHIMU
MLLIRHSSLILKETKVLSSLPHPCSIHIHACDLVPSHVSTIVPSI